MAKVGIKVTLCRVSMISLALTNWLGKKDEVVVVEEGLDPDRAGGGVNKLSRARNVPVASLVFLCAV